AAIGFAYHSRSGIPAGNAEAAGTASTGATPLVITSVVDEGDTVRLAWIDPSQGRASFVISLIGDDGTGQPLHQVPPGQAGTIVTGLDPQAQRLCFRVLAVDGS